MHADGSQTGSSAPMSTVGSLLRTLLEQAGRAALDHAGQGRTERKADGSPVTRADRAAEAILAQGLARAFPDDAIVGEEGTRHPGGSGRTWVIDPIDGTDAFTHGLPAWGPTVACLEGGGVRFGALLLPRTGDYWFADLPPDAPPAAWLGDRRLPRLAPGPPHRGASLFVPSRLHHVATVAWPGKLRCLGSTAAHLAWVASGGAHAALVGPSPAWDTAAGCALIQAVGGVVQPLSSPGDAEPRPRPVDPWDLGPVLVAGRAAAVASLLQPDVIRLHGDPRADLR